MAKSPPIAARITPYCSTNMELSVISWGYRAGCGPTFRVGDVCRFAVAVRNKGDTPVPGLRLMARGSTWAEVGGIWSTDPGGIFSTDGGGIFSTDGGGIFSRDHEEYPPFSATVMSDAHDVAPRSIVHYGWFYTRAKAPSRGPVDLLRLTLEGVTTPSTARRELVAPA